MTVVDIGHGKTGRRAYDLDEIAIVPSRRTRDPEDVSTAWQLDAYRFELPLMSAPSDSVTSPATAIEVARLGGLGVLDLEGLWTRYDDPEPVLAEIAELDPAGATARLQELYAHPVDPDLIGARIAEMREAGGITAGSLTPQSVERLHAVALEAGLDVLVIGGTVVSAEHVSSRTDPLNLKDFIARYDIPVVVGGCASYASALHLMRTGAAGVLVGTGTEGSRGVLGLGVGQATAIADAASARSRHLEETRRDVQIIAAGGMRTGGDVAKAIAVGADAVMLDEPLARASDAPGRGAHWTVSAGHATLPRGRRVDVAPVGTLEEVLVGPGRDGEGTTNLFGALARTMALCGCEDVTQLQRADVTVGPPS
ncbi:GuaB3 family IMP dehydrogenase-related protein [Euzebya sp.]|uniref:GuaB3 family IMP dehydrogenase-related protein n=1 Tax=Euzebya sp. TaxID=1971409 RepID=UPI0035181D62